MKCAVLVDVVDKPVFNMAYNDVRLVFHQPLSICVYCVVV